MAGSRYGDGYDRGGGRGDHGAEGGARYREFDRDDDRGGGGGGIFNMGGGRSRGDSWGRGDNDRSGSWGRDEHDRGGSWHRDDDHRGGSWGRGNEQSGGMSGRGGREVEHRGQHRDSGRGFGPDDHRKGLPTDETGHLIASNKVEGTAVYGRDGERLGSIYNFMVDKLSGKVEYAVMAYGGFVGLGERYYPLPWRTLSYDTRAGGYRIGMTRRDLKSAPSFDRNTEPRFDRSYGSRVHDYYGLNY